MIVVSKNSIQSASLDSLVNLYSVNIINTHALLTLNTLQKFKKMLFQKKVFKYYTIEVKGDIYI